MKWCLIARYVADTYIGGVTVKNKPKLFNSENEARAWGRNNISICKYVAMWDAVLFTKENQNSFFQHEKA